MKKNICISVLLILYPIICYTASFNSPTSLYSDSKAYYVGDIVTIHIVEQSSSENRSRIDSGSKTKFGLSLGEEGLIKNFSSLSFSGGVSYDSDKDKKSYSRETLTTKISAQIVSIDSTGNFKIRGQKTVIVNGSERTTILTGIVRPEDIQANNIIYSYNIYNAEIKYEGKGISSTKPNLFARILDWIF